MLTLFVICIIVLLLISTFAAHKFPGWNELLISTIAHQSVASLREGSLILVGGFKLTRDLAGQVGMSNIFERVLSEIVTKMRDMAIDKTELGCMRAIVLFNPGLIITILCLSKKGIHRVPTSLVARALV